MEPIRPAPYVEPPPKIIALDFDANGDVLCTWSLPGLQTATVRMAYRDWLEGRGQSIGKLLYQMQRDAGLVDGG